MQLQSVPRTSAARAAADIRAAAPMDAVITAREELAELQARFTDMRAMKTATAALLFGSDAAWRQALARVGVACGRQITALASLERTAGVNQEIKISSIAKPIGPTTRVCWTGD